MKMNYNEDPKFTRELKKLIKKWRKLPLDFQKFKQLHTSIWSPDQKQFRDSLFQTTKATILHKDAARNLIVVKARLDSTDLNGAKLRVVYCINQTQAEITWLEIFFKGDREREDSSHWRSFVNQ